MWLVACTGSFEASSTGAPPGGNAAMPPAGTAGSGGAAPPSPGASAPSSTGCSATPNVGPAPLRRLTREQYANAVRDLLGARPSVDTLPADEVVGPFATNLVAVTTDLVAQQFMESAERLARANATKADMLAGCPRPATTDDACAARFIDRFGLRAYRRPLTDAEKARYRALHDGYARAGGFVEGVRMVMQTMLQSPHFLYHVELGEMPSAAVVPLSAYALASRLSFLLWNTIPDEALLTAAGSGGLETPDGIGTQLRRLLADARARDALAHFHLQWLDLDRVSQIAKDDMLFPLFDATVRTAMRSETIAFVDHVVRAGDGKLETLLTAPFSFLDGKLFDIYGVARPTDHDPKRPVMLDPAQRAGLLTQTAMLAVHAHANQTSPIARGVVIRRNVLCQDLPDPPPDVNSTPPAPKAGATTRERFIEHKKSPSCSGCHGLIDDIGFGFEGYDAIGAWRAMDGGKPVDRSGTLTGTDVDGPFDGAVALAGRLAGSEQVRGCVARQWFRFALGRPEGEADACSLSRALDAFAASGHDIRALLGALVTSDAFRYRRGEP